MDQNITQKIHVIGDALKLSSAAVAVSVNSMFLSKPDTTGAEFLAGVVLYGVGLLLTGHSFMRNLDAWEQRKGHNKSSNLNNIEPPCLTSFAIAQGRLMREKDAPPKQTKTTKFKL